MSAGGAGAGTAAAGGVIGAYGQLYEGYAESAAAELNAGIAKQNAVSALQQAAIESRRLAVHGAKVIGDMRASYGASGVTAEGSALDVLKESAANVAFDALNLKHQGEARAVAYRNEANLDEYRAGTARRSGEIGAVATLARAAGGAAGA